MAEFRATEEALADVAANARLEFGTHLADELMVAVPGLMVADVEYNPARHLPTDINPFSFMEAATGAPQVRQVLPQQPLEVSVIVHAGDTQDHSGVAGAKERLGNQLTKALEDSLPGMTDRIHSYLISEGKDAETGVGWDRQVIHTQNPMESAASVAELSANGLALVIGDFSKLPLHEMPRSNYPSTVAVKVNHPYELAVPAGSGVWSLGGKRELNTNKPKELAKFNAALSERHRQIALRLTGVGIAVAQVVYRPKDAYGLGFEMPATDRAIAQALRQVTPR